MRFTLAVALSLLAACASTPSAAPVAAPNAAATVNGDLQPEIQVVQLSNVASAARHMTGGVSVQYRIAIRNPRNEAIYIRRLDMMSVGMGAYTLPTFSRAFDDVLAPNETKTLDVWAPAVIDDTTIVGANGPVTLRAIVLFKGTDGKQWQTVVVQQVSAAGSPS
jgi:hypothetical protein